MDPNFKLILDEIVKTKEELGRRFEDQDDKWAASSIDQFCLASYSTLIFPCSESLFLQYFEQNMRMGVGSVHLSNIDGMIQGVNYESAAAGIISSSDSVF
jgi:hypothetical protein